MTWSDVGGQRLRSHSGSSMWWWCWSIEVLSSSSVMLQLCSVTVVHWTDMAVAAWRCGNGIGRSYSTSTLVSTGMGDVSGFDSQRQHFISVCNQPPRSTQPFILSRSINWVVSCNRMFAFSHRWCHLVNAYCLWGEGLVWLIGAVVCLLAACRGSNCTLTRAMDGRNLCCSTIGSCQSTATSKIVKRGWSWWFTV